MSLIAGIDVDTRAVHCVSFTVLGVPAPQGSMVRTKWGVRPDNPNTKPWRQAVAAEAQYAMGHTTRVPLQEPLGQFLGPVAVFADLFFPRPKAHYGTGKNAGTLKDSAPFWHTTTPDGDKLARALGDAMTGIVFRDDSQVAMWVVCKHYGTPARAEIQVSDRWTWQPGTAVEIRARLALDTNTAAA